MIQQTAVPNLWILPSGPGTTSATNLLYSNHMASLIHYLKEEFDAILIDTPPMLQIPDARVVARLADSVIMVVRAHQTTRDAVSAACQRFSEDGTKVLGTILNDWNPKSSPNGYYGYDKSYGRYGRYYSHKD
jgi:capsular exopolysaccharide synthesis family protein